MTAAAERTGLSGSGLPSAASLGLGLFLASLAMLFASTLVAYAAVRWSVPSWPPPGSPPLPGLLWASTALLLLSSGSVHAAVRGARDGHQGLLRGALAATCVLGVGFLASQAVCWVALRDSVVAGEQGLFGLTFYLLTVLHALHFVGGAGPLAVTTARAFGGRYGPDAHQGVRLCAMYWHFLDAAWLTIFVALVLV